MLNEDNNLVPVVEHWKVVDRWWTDTSVEKEYMAIADGTTWVRERIGEMAWTDWKIYEGG